MSSIPQIPPVHKWGQMLTFSVLEQLYPREVVSELLSQDQAEEQRTQADASGDGLPPHCLEPDGSQCTAPGV